MLTDSTNSTAIEGENNFYNPQEFQEMQEINPLNNNEANEGNLNQSFDDNNDYENVNTNNIIFLRQHFDNLLFYNFNHSDNTNDSNNIFTFEDLTFPRDIPQPHLIAEENVLRSLNIRQLFNIYRSRNVRGRIPLSLNRRTHTNSDFDNLQTKIQVHFLTFIINISNDAVLAELGDKNISFKDISYKIKKEVNYQNCTKLKNSTIKDILENDISEKYKQFKRDFNVNTLNKVYNSSDWLNKFFNMKYLEMFEIYYSKGKPLKEFIFEGKKITLSKTTKTFYDLLNKKGNVEIQNKLKETARIAYLDGYDFLLGKKNSFKVIK